MKLRSRIDAASCMPHSVGQGRSQSSPDFSGWWNIFHFLMRKTKSYWKGCGYGEVKNLRYFHSQCHTQPSLEKHVSPDFSAPAFGYSFNHLVISSFWTMLTFWWASDNLLLAISFEKIRSSNALDGIHRYLCGEICTPPTHILTCIDLLMANCLTIFAKLLFQYVIPGPTSFTHVKLLMGCYLKTFLNSL